MSSSERDLEQWMTGLVSESIGAYTKKKIENLRGVDFAPTSVNPEYSAGSGGCARLSFAASMVYSSLDSESSPGEAKAFDHASLSNGGSIVYGDALNRQLFTSKPYTEPSGSGSDDVVVGEVWWRRYIPEDWEFVLDKLTDRQWEETKVQDLVCYCIVCLCLLRREAATFLSPMPDLLH
jgi:hypothetical protein